tara:strand:+ start:3937 stop:4953 length:1017 start_codon:yes stop_codon:yes gene_type:complete
MDHAQDAIDAARATSRAHWIVCTFTTYDTTSRWLDLHSLVRQKKLSTALRWLGSTFTGHEVPCERSVPWMMMLTEDGLRAALDTLADSGMRTSSIASYHVAYKGFVDYLRGEGHLPVDLCDRLDRVLKLARVTVNSDPLLAGRMLTNQEIAKIMSMSTDTKRDRAIIALITLHMTTGVRGGELGPLSMRDWDRHAERLSIFESKTRKERHVEALPELAEALNAHCGDRPTTRGGEALVAYPHGGRWIRFHYNLIHMVYREVAERVGVAAFTPHDIRRTVASLLMSSTADAFLVAKILGHKDPAVSLKYDRRSLESRRRAMSVVTSKMRKPRRLEGEQP